MTMVVWLVVVKNPADYNEEFTTMIKYKNRKYTLEKRKYVFKFIIEVNGFIGFLSNFYTVKFIVNKENID